MGRSPDRSFGTQATSLDQPLTFGLWLKQRRKACDLTQEQLGERVGCAAETIRKIEADARRPSRETAERLVRALEVPLAERAALVSWARDALVGTAPPSAPGDVAAAARSAGPDLPLLKSKLSLPRARAGLVARPRLLARLDAGVAGRLTLVMAPPGFGKTTLLVAWLLHAQASPDHADSAQTIAAPPLAHAAWLTLDERDSEPLLFLQYLIATLRGIVPDLGTAALRLLETGAAPDLRAVLRLLADDLGWLPQHSALILDDYHTISAPLIHEAVSFLLEKLPPQLHLVIASRTTPPLPLARLRVRGELTELHPADLRFTSAEATVFLQAVMRLPLAADAVAALVARTEGWIAGLQLAALSIHEQPPEQAQAFIASFAGTNHLVLEYLVDEVLARQPAPLRAFLLQTSMLDRMSGALCDAVLGKDEGRRRKGEKNSDGSATSGIVHPSSFILDELDRANLFLTPLDAERVWYRYHGLFRDVLRDRLLRDRPAAEIALLHRRASQWFEQQGLPDDAIQHALAARDWNQAARLVARAAGALIPGNLGQHQRLRAWVTALPEEVVRAQPQLCLLRARIAVLTDIDQAAHWLGLAEQALVQREPDAAAANTRGELLALRAGVAVSRGAAAQAIAAAEQAFVDLDPANVGVRGELLQHLARAHLAQRDTRRAAAAFAQQAALARGADKIATFVPETNLAYVQRLQGKLAAAMYTCQQALAWATHTGAAAAPDASWALAALADLLREQNALDEALARAREAAARSKQLAVPNLSLLCTLVLARVHQARREYDQALALFGEIYATVDQFRVLPLHEMFRAFEAQLYLQQNRIALAQALVDEQELQVATDSYRISPILLVYHDEHPAIARAQLQLARGQASGDLSQLHEARRLLEQQQQRADDEARQWLQVKLLVLRALAEHALNNLPQALDLLRPAVALAAATGFLRLFLDEGPPLAALVSQLNAQAATNDPIGAYVARLLAAFAAEPGS
jgi:LuxR family transcriptional regulator, maltose regulon positive regulatory protein